MPIGFRYEREPPRRCYVGDISLLVPSDWFDVTEPGEPITLARTDGTGALQFSVGLYKSGGLPNFTAEQLRELLLANRGVDEAADIVVGDTPPLAACTFAIEDGNQVRMWYVSDGVNLAMATYTSGAPPDPQEPAAAEAMVRSIRFAPSLAQ